MERLQDWQEGIEHFNQRLFWEAHEAWERGWLALPPAEKLHIQSLIQAAGAMHLIGVGRFEPAQKLAASALQKMKDRDLEGAISTIFPRVDVPGLEKALGEIRDSDAG